MSVFEVGAVVLPARDGTLSDLGFDVGQLKNRALGILLERRGQNKALVRFPYIGVQPWLSFDELVDVSEEARLGNESFLSICPSQGSELDLKRYPLLWKVPQVLKTFSALGLRYFDSGVGENIVGDEIKQYLPSVLNLDQKMWSIGVHLEKWDCGDFERVEKIFGSHLIHQLLIPGSMSKLVLALLLKPDEGLAAI